MLTPKVYVVAILSMLLLSFTGCTQPAASPQEEAAEEEKPLVIATLFPQYDFVRQVAGDRVRVILLLPPGIEPHNYEPSPRDIAEILKADLFVYTGAIMEPWAERIINAAEGTDLLVIDTSIGIELLGEAEHQDHGDEKDPHFWLDPLSARVMVDHIVEGLSLVDPDNVEHYRQNGEAYKQKLQDLHEQIAESLAGLENRTIIYAGHFAFGYFTSRYDLNHVSPYEGFAPDAEPTPANIAELIKKVRQSNTRVIFYGELIEPKVAAVIAEQTGAEMALLHGAHNVTAAEMQSGITYISIMEDNLAKLLRGLK